MRRRQADPGLREQLTARSRVRLQRQQRVLGVDRVTFLDQDLGDRNVPEITDVGHVHLRRACCTGFGHGSHYFLPITQFVGLITMAQPSENTPMIRVGDLTDISNHLKERRMCSSCTIDKIDVIMDEALEYEIPSDILDFMRNADDECLAGIYYLVSKEADPVDYAVSRLGQVSLFRGYLSSYARHALRNGQLGEISPNLWRYVNMRMLISDLEKTHVEFTFLGETWVSNKTNEA